MQYRKKPVVIEAFEFQLKTKEPYPEWFRDAIESGDAYFQGGLNPYYTIKTPEGDLRADLGDWIIRGVKGEFYPIKDDIFQATYESV